MNSDQEEAFRRLPPAGLTRDPQAWRRAWLRAKGRSPVNIRERHDRQAEISRWDRRASSYAEHADSEPNRARPD